MSPRAVITIATFGVFVVIAAVFVLIVNVRPWEVRRVVEPPKVATDKAKVESNVEADPDAFARRVNRVAIGVFLFCLWLLPIVIAFLRRHPDVVAIAAVDLIFGWTVVGWGVAFVWSVKAFLRYDAYQPPAPIDGPPPPRVVHYGDIADDPLDFDR